MHVVTDGSVKIVEISLLSCLEGGFWHGCTSRMTCLSYTQECVCALYVFERQHTLFLDRLFEVYSGIPFRFLVSHHFCPLSLVARHLQVLYWTFFHPTKPNMTPPDYHRRWRRGLQTGTTHPHRPPPTALSRLRSTMKKRTMTTSSFFVAQVLPDTVYTACFLSAWSCSEPMLPRTWAIQVEGGLPTKQRSALT